MAAVAVLLMPQEMTVVAVNIRPMATPRCPRDRASSAKAIFRSSCWVRNAVASAKPPKNRKTMGSAKGAKALVVVRPGMPSSSAPTGASRAVTASGRASVSHSTPMNTSSARPFLAASSNGRNR